MRQYLPCGQVNAENYPELNRTVTDEEYEIVEEALYSSTIEDGFVQDESAASGDFIPVFDNTGVWDFSPYEPYCIRWYLA